MPESIASEVVSACVGGMFSASALYPLEVLKTRMQAEGDVGECMRSKSELLHHGEARLLSCAVANNALLLLLR